MVAVEGLKQMTCLRLLTLAKVVVVGIIHLFADLPFELSQPQIETGWSAQA